MSESTTSQTEAWIAEAYERGKEAAESAATWVTDGNESDESRARKLALMDEGDPAIDAYLPAYPNLSGEWSGDPTPYSLAVDIVGEDLLGDMPYPGSDSFVDSLADAFEQGVSDHFELACETELRRWTRKD